MRVVFMGTPAFAVPSLEALAATHTVVAVYTRPDAVSGRGKKLLPSPVKESACALGLPVRTPRTLRDDEECAMLASLAPDLIVVVAYGMLLPPAVLAVPRLATLNVHASLLPRWRGAAPIQRAILAGDERVGISLMRIEEGLDTGDFCATVAIPAAERSYPSLEAELATLGADMLVENIPVIAQGSAVWTMQDASQATYADKLMKAELRLDPSASALLNVRRVRASSPQAPARAIVCDRSATITDAREVTDVPDLAPGSVRYWEKRLLLGTIAGGFEVVRIKPDGGRELPADAFAAGANTLRSSEEALWKAVV